MKLRECGEVEDLSVLTWPFAVSLYGLAMSRALALTSNCSKDKRTSRSDVLMAVPCQGQDLSGNVENRDRSAR